MTEPGKEVVEFSPIGYVENRFHDNVPSDVGSTESKIQIATDLREGLSGLEQGVEVLILFWCHRSQGFELLQHPRGDTNRPKRGVFTLRSPHRPNAIALTRVRVLDIEGCTLRVAGLDALDGTPVLDLKPASS